jgi:hypothetical protein
VKQLRLVWTLLAITWLARDADADPRPYASTWHPTVETDLADPIVFRGFQIGGGVRPGGDGLIHHLRARAFFVHQVIPGFFTDFDAQDKGWGNTVNLGVLAVDYFFRDGRRGGFHLTPSVAIARATLTPPDGSSAAHETRLNLVAGAAYQWFPFANGFYLQPWAFLIISPARLSGTSTAPNGERFHDPTVIPALDLQLGYEF